MEINRVDNGTINRVDNGMVEIFWIMYVRKSKLKK